MSRTGDWFMRVHGDFDDDDGYDRFKDELEWALAEKEFKAREKAEQHILEKWSHNANLELESVNHHNGWENLPENRDKFDFVYARSEDFFSAIWHASTEILPGLEVQVVIDGKNNCYVTTGSPGYVEFGMQPPIGMSLPIKCWIHTHPFGSAYFSGVDIKTVSQWQPLMKEAFVLGGWEYDHYGHWQQSNPKQLEIYRNAEVERIQTWGQEPGSEEE